MKERSLKRLINWSVTNAAKAFALLSQMHKELSGQALEIDRMWKGFKRQRSVAERPMRCCGRNYRGISTWLPHFRNRHPRAYSRLLKRSELDRTSYMLKAMRAAWKSIA